jgi:SAM-dependent methyltransferase
MSRFARYGQIGGGYSLTRREDPRISSAIRSALGEARSVVNVGAGTGSYEPDDRYVIAVEPSDVMAAQRPPTIPPAIRASAADLPLLDDSVDAAMAVLTIHHWDDELERGIQELRRVARDTVVILTYDPVVSGEMWLMADYLPEAAELDRRTFPAPELLVGWLGGRTRIEVLPIARDTPDWMLARSGRIRNACSTSVRGTRPPVSHVWMPRWFGAWSETCAAISKAALGTNGTGISGSSTPSTRGFASWSAPSARRADRGRADGARASSRGARRSWPSGSPVA